MARPYWRGLSRRRKKGSGISPTSHGRLAFLSAEELERLGKVFGVCVHAAELARIITREPVLALR